MELPEVEVVRRDLEKDVIGRRVVAVEVRRMKNTKRVIRRHKSPKEFRDRLVGHKLTRAERKGKYVLLHLDDGNVLVVHFGMSGRFLRGNKRLPQRRAATSDLGAHRKDHPQCLTTTPT